MANTTLVFEKGSQGNCSDSWNWELEGSKTKTKHTEKLNTNNDQNNEKFRIALISALSKRKRAKAPIAGNNMREDNKKDKRKDYNIVNHPLPLKLHTKFFLFTAFHGSD